MYIIITMTILSKKFEEWSSNESKVIRYFYILIVILCIWKIPTASVKVTAQIQMVLVQVVSQASARDYASASVLYKLDNIVARNSSL